MNSKLIVVGSISAAVGAVVSWAVTADHYENKLRELDEATNDVARLLRMAEDKIYDLTWTVDASTKLETDKDLLTDEIILGSEAEATDVLTSLREIVSGHGVATRHDLFDLVGLRGHYKDSLVGWSNLDKAFVGADPTGWKINFPPIEDLTAPVEVQPEESAVIVSPEPIDDIGADEGQEDEHGLRPVSEPDDVVPVIPPGETVEETRANLRNIISEYIENEDDRDHFVAQAERIEPLRNETPIIISQAEYAYSEDYNHYDKQTLIYYPNHRLLLDEDEDVVAQIPYVIGWRNLSDNAFGNESGDPDTVFIRNHKMMTDFEIVRETDEQPPLHVQYGMSKDEYDTNRAAGLIRPPRFGPEDQ